MSNFNGMLDKVKEGVKEGLTKSGLRVERSMKKNIRSQKLIDSGRLVNSPTSVITDNGDYIKGEFGTNIEYAYFHEFGTSRFQARPFIRPAYRENEKHFKKDVINAIKKSIKSL